MDTLRKNKIRFERAEDVSALLNFKCGVKQMDDFIHSEHEYKDKGLLKHIEFGLSYLWLVYEKEKVIAFFTLSKDVLILSSADKDMIEKSPKANTFPNGNEKKFWERGKYAAIGIDYLAVSKEKQKNKIGTAIIAKIEEYAREDKLSSTLFLTVEALDNEKYSSTDFYKKCGFRLSEAGKTRNENMEREGLEPFTIRMYKRILPANE